MICKSKLYKTMDELGYSESLCGTRYIQSAVNLVSADRSISMMKEVYPAVARAAGTSAQRVERAMRTATEAAMRSPNWQWAWREIGGWNHPTNSEVIHRLARECQHED